MGYNEEREKGGWWGPLRHMGIGIPAATEPGFDGWLRAKQAELGLTVDGVLGPGTAYALHKAHNKQSGLSAGLLTANISLDEMQDGHCVCPPDLLPALYYTAAVAQAVRDRVWGEPCGIVSGFRDEAYNIACGGALHSKHMLAQAVDIRPQGEPCVGGAMNAACNKVYKMMQLGELPWGAIVTYPSKDRPWIHVDWRGSFYHEDWTIVK